MLRPSLIKQLLRYNYPQSVFGAAIKAYIGTSHVKAAHVVDCPCGNGETAYHLAQLPGAAIVAADLSAECIRNAQANFQRPNIEFICADINTVIDSMQQTDVFCIINSLFLLTGAKDTLGRIRAKLAPSSGRLLLIIPNTEGKNFKWFLNNFPGENKLVISHEQIFSFFEPLGYKVELVKPLAYAHHYNRGDVKLFSVLWPFYLSFLNFLQKSFKIGTANYFLIALSV